MKRFRYRLAPLLRLRRAEEEKAREMLVLANSALRAEQQAHEAAVASYAALAHEESGEIAMVDLLVERASSERAADLVAQRAQRVALATQNLASARLGYRRAARDVAVLERLEERRRAEHRTETEREEARATDDLVATRYALDVQAGSR